MFLPAAVRLAPLVAITRLGMSISRVRSLGSETGARAAVGQRISRFWRGEAR